MPSIAPLVAAIQRRIANLPGPARGSGEASNGEPVQIELLVAGAWVDITSYDLVWDDNGQIGITSGSRDQGSQTQAAQSSLQLSNLDGRFSPKNPLGAYYDILAWRNAQIRISVPDGNGGKRYLIWGEASEWAPAWDKSGSSVWTDVTVHGIMQRLAQAPNPEHSVIYRAITDPQLTGLVAYWPCEDPTGSTVFASALTNGSPMTWTGTPVLAAYDGFAASDPLPTLTGAALTGGVAKYDTSTVTGYQMRFLLAVPAAGFSDLDVIARLQVAEVSAGASLLDYFDIHYNDPPGGLGSFGARGTLTIQVKDGDENPFGSAASTSMDVRGRLLRVSLENSISSTTITSTLRILDITSGLTDSTSITIASTSMSRVLELSLAPTTLGGSAGLPSGAAGHLLLQTTITDIGDLGRAIQPTGETAGRRIQRLCGEEGVAFEWIGDLDDTALMGPQGKSNLLTLVQECEQADGGFLYETTDQLGLGYRTRSSLYGQDPALVLSYTGFNLADIPVPVSDDRYVQNQVVVTVNGVSQTYTETSGALGTDTIGVYGETSGVTLNLATSDEATLRDQAAWRVRLGTVDDERYPTVTVNLAHSSITPELKRAILGLRMGDRMQMTGMPSWLSPDTVDQLIIGTDRSVNHFVHEITFTCLPAAPYNQIANVDDTDARIDIDGSELLTAIGTSTTQLNVTPSAGYSMLWTTDTADMPFDVRMGGEIMTVTGVSSMGADQFGRSVSNGWGTADSGQTWSLLGGAASERSTDGTRGLITLTSTTDQIRINTLLDDINDCEVIAKITPAQVSTGNHFLPAIILRSANASTFYRVRLIFRTDNAVYVVPTASFNEVGPQINTGLTYAANDAFWLRARIDGQRVRARVWRDDGVESPYWIVDQVITSGSLTGGSVGVSSSAFTGNTNASLIAYFDEFSVLTPQTLTVTRSVNGVVKAHTAGTPVSLAYPTYVAL